MANIIERAENIFEKVPSVVDSVKGIVGDVDKVMNKSEQIAVKIRDRFIVDAFRHPIIQKAVKDGGETLDIIAEKMKYGLICVCMLVLISVVFIIAHTYSPELSTKINVGVSVLYVGLFAYLANFIFLAKVGATKAKSIVYDPNNGIIAEMQKKASTNIRESLN